MTVAAQTAVTMWPSIALPATAYLPGQTTRPPDELFEPLKSGLGADASPADLANTAAFRCGLDLFRRGYYWEAHELLEAVWMRLPPASAEKLLLRGLIQLANAGLKNRLGWPVAARRILALADDALQEATRRKPVPMMCLTSEDLRHLRAQAAGDSM